MRAMAEYRSGGWYAMTVPADIQQRFDQYCAARQQTAIADLGYGVDGYLWRVTGDSVIKVFRHDRQFDQELAVYQRLTARRIDRLQGFAVPILLNHDSEQRILELSLVSPPFVLDFAAAGLDAPPPGFDPDDPVWLAEKQRLYGGDWHDVKRLLDALRLYGIHFADVHLGNIRLRP
jgi:hypothetical protein